MTSKTIICAIAAASFSFASLSFADDDDRRGGERYKDDGRHDRGDRRKKSWLNDIFN